MLNCYWEYSSSVEFLATEVSDHCPAFIQLKPEVRSVPKPFRFFNFWTKHEGFLKIVENRWDECVMGNHMNVLHIKLKRLKRVLKDFNMEMFGSLLCLVSKKKKELAAVQDSVLKDPQNNDLVILESKLSKELQNLLEADQKSFYRQKARVTWIHEGDQNTSFFHKTVNAKKNMNTIHSFISS
ncbi:hypothetical protein DITRI_Ditri01bG0085600 [Diplodiscus trichospermus]